MNSFDPEEIFKNTASNHVKTAARRTIHSHRWYRGTFKDISPHVPGPFSVVPFQHEGLVNPLYRVICSDKGMPLSIVTKSYVLIDHCDVVESLARSLRELERDIGLYPTELYIGDGGAKFSLRLVLPDIAFDPGDGHPVAGRVEILNSVDRSIPFRLNMGHFRLVCSNGLMMLKSTFDLLALHIKGKLDKDKVDGALAEGLKQLPRKGDSYRALYNARIPPKFTGDLLESIQKVWGNPEAEEINRAWADGIYRKAEVPGINVPAVSLWDIYNSLTWISGRSRDLASQLKTSETAHRILSEALEKYRISLN
jgi:hypothetical protein